MRRPISMHDASTVAAQPAEGAQASRIVRAISPHLFYGWVIVAMCFIAQIMTSLSMQGLSTYVGPLQREFGWSAGATAGRSFQQTDTFLGPVNGWLVDRFGARTLMSVGVVLYMLSFVAFSQVSSLWTFYAACLLMALSNSLVGLLVVNFILNRWFRRKRTTAMGLAVVGFAVAGAVFIPLTVWAQTEYGWRAAALGTGIGILLIGAPIVLLMRDAPEPYGLLPDGEQPAHTGPGGSAHARGGLVNFTLRQALRTRTFWLIVAGTTLVNLVQSALVVHQFPYLELSLTRETAALVLSVSNMFNIAGRLVGGVLGDRMAKHRLMGLNALSSTAGVLALAVATSLPPLLLYGACFGFSWGVRAAVANSLQGDYFGRAAFGRIVGLTQTLASPAAVVAPVIVGVAADTLGGYRAPFLLLAGFSAASSLLFFAAARPTGPTRPLGGVSSLSTVAVTDETGQTAR